MYQLGLSFQAVFVTGVVNLSGGEYLGVRHEVSLRGGQISFEILGKFARSRITKPSGVLTNDRILLGNVFPLHASVSPTSGAWAAI
jgi:hypothetical protein